jgi:ATP-binding cassette subfamily G (WHITE) protein 2 (SNQ2)
MAPSSEKTTDPDVESRGPSPPETSVNVEAAEKLFSTLSHRLSRKPDQGQDATLNDDVRFDLEGYLQNEKQQKQNAGLHDKHVDVSWDMTVQGKADTRRYQPTFLDACLDMFGLLSTLRGAIGGLSKSTRADTFNILSDFKGIAKSGTMTLVLGRPGSGCTTFLKVLANYRAGFTDISGDVYYNGIPSAEFGEKYNGETAYNQEDDVFLPTLTVKQVSLPHSLGTIEYTSNNDYHRP